MTGPRRIRLLALLLGVLVVALLRMHVDVAGDHRHHLHVLARGLFLLPPVLGGLWFGLRGGAAFGLLSAAAFGAQLALRGATDPMDGAAQLAQAATILAAGLGAGAFVDGFEAVRRRKLRALDASERELLLQGIVNLAAALSGGQTEVRAHGERVASLATRVGKRLGLGPAGIDTLRLAALVHDVARPPSIDDVVTAREALTPELRRAVELHPWAGADVVGRIRGAGEVAEIVLCHHECPDGSGYPRGLREDDVPMEAHILRVADVYDTLTMQSPREPALSPEEALWWMRASGPGNLHEGATAALAKLVREGTEGTRPRAASRVTGDVSSRLATSASIERRATS